MFFTLWQSICGVYLSSPRIFLPEKSQFTLSREATNEMVRGYLRIGVPLIAQILTPWCLFLLRTAMQDSTVVFPTYMAVLLIYHNFFARYFTLGFLKFIFKNRIIISDYLSKLQRGWYLSLQYLRYLGIFYDGTYGNSYQKVFQNASTLWKYFNFLFFLTCCRIFCFRQLFSVQNIWHL